MEAFISTFHIDLGVMIAQAFNFIIVMVVLYFLALKPLRKLMDDREDKISKGIEDAKMHSNLLTLAQKEQEDILNKARKEAHDVFEIGKKEASEIRQSMIDNANVEIALMLENGKKIIETERSTMIEEARKEIVTLVVKATEKLLETHKNKDYDEKALEQIKNV